MRRLLLFGLLPLGCCECLRDIDCNTTQRQVRFYVRGECGEGLAVASLRASSCEFGVSAARPDGAPLLGGAAAGHLYCGASGPERGHWTLETSRGGRSQLESWTCEVRPADGALGLDCRYRLCPPGCEEQRCTGTLTPAP